MHYKPDFESTKPYFEAFWQHELIDRPPVHLTCFKEGAAPAAPLFSSVECYEACMSGDITAYADNFEQYADAVDYLAEAIPYMMASIGPDVFAAFFGAPLKAVKGHITTWAEPIVDDFETFQPVLDTSPDSTFGRVQTMLKALQQRAEGKYLIGIQDLHSNMDALSALRGPQDLCIDLYDCPEEIHRVHQVIRDAYPQIYEMSYQTANGSALGCIGWAPTYCQGKFAVIQCDFSALISPDFVREFAIPALREEAAYLDHCVYHYDGKDALGHLDDILAIEDIDCIQWVPGDGQPPSFEWMDLLKKIQSAGKSLWIYDWSPAHIRQYYKELNPALVFFHTSTPSRAEGESLLKWMKENT